MQTRRLCIPICFELVSVLIVDVFSVFITLMSSHAKTWSQYGFHMHDLRHSLILATRLMSEQRGYSARQEMNEIGGHSAFAESRSRLTDAMRLTMTSELRRLEGGLSFLATVGSTAPFIGLFGTVWGIIHSFTSIAQARDTSLAVVAPGIAEALFATAVGLFAAIPAVIAYNQVLRELSRASQRMSSAIALIAKAAARGRAQQGTGEISA